MKTRSRPMHKDPPQFLLCRSKVFSHWRRLEMLIAVLSPPLSILFFSAALADIYAPLDWKVLSAYSTIKVLASEGSHTRLPEA